MPIPTVEWRNNKVRIIDQSALPHQLKFIYCNSPEAVWRAIRDMKIRGAPAIGVIAAYGVYLGVRDSGKRLFNDLRRTTKYLATSRPTARNLFWALERMEKVAFANRNKSTAELKKILLREAGKMFEEDRKICRRIGKYGSRLIKRGDTVLTHCNAGGLATVDFGTALGVIFTAHKEGKGIKVYADETRPVLQGARLTVWELMCEGIDVTLISDNMAACLMAKKKIDKIIVGADRIARNGDTANKIGTYNLAVLAHYHRVPFYVAAPLSTIDMNMKSGRDIPIEKRDPDEVRRVAGVYISPKGVKVFNPAFDVTPNGLISAIITEKGILRRPYLRSIKTVFG